MGRQGVEPVSARYSKARATRLVNLAQKAFEESVRHANRAERFADKAREFGKAMRCYKYALRALADCKNQCARAHSHAWSVRDMTGDHSPEFDHAIDAAAQSKVEVHRAEQAVEDAACEYQIAHPNRSLPRT